MNSPQIINPADRALLILAGRNPDERHLYHPQQGVTADKFRYKSMGGKILDETSGELLDLHQDKRLSKAAKVLEEHGMNGEEATLLAAKVLAAIGGK